MEEDLSQDEKNKNMKCSVCGDIKSRDLMAIIINEKFICMECSKNLSEKVTPEIKPIFWSDLKTFIDFFKESERVFIKLASEAIEKHDKSTLYVQEIYNVIDTHKQNAVSVLTSEQIKYGNKILSELHLTDNPIEINTPEGIRIFKDCYEKDSNKMADIFKKLI
jgi:hypothetical protein